MARINVYSRSTEEFDQDEPRLLGWFDPDKAVERVQEDTEWDGNNHVGTLSGLQCGYEELFRTAGGRWVRHYNARNQFNGPEFYEFLTDDEAKDWLLRNTSDEIVERYFGEIAEEHGPGRPSVTGSPVSIKLGEIEAAVETWRAARGLSRAEAVRQLVAKALANEPSDSSSESTVALMAEYTDDRDRLVS